MHSGSAKAKPSLFDYFGQFLCSWIWIRFRNTDPDSRTEKSMQIHADPDPLHCWIPTFFIVTGKTPVFRFGDILAGIRISVHWITDSDPASFFSGFRQKIKSADESKTKCLGTWENYTIKMHQNRKISPCCKIPIRTEAVRISLTKEYQGDR
jgi:hypothetical protein